MAMGDKVAMPWLVIILFNPQCSTRTYLLVGYKRQPVAQTPCGLPSMAMGNEVALPWGDTSYPAFYARPLARQRSCFARSTDGRAIKLTCRTNSPRHGNRANGNEVALHARPNVGYKRQHVAQTSRVLPSMAMEVWGLLF